MGKKVKRLICSLLTAAILFAGLHTAIPVEAAQTTYSLDCRNSAWNVRSAIQKANTRFRAYDKMLFTNLDMSKVDIKVDFYVDNKVAHTLTPTMESENGCYIRMPYVVKKDKEYDYWGLFDVVTTVSNGVTTVTIKMFSVQNESIYGIYTYAVLNQEIQDTVKKALPGEHVLIDVGETQSLTKYTMAAIAANREIDITLIHHTDEDAYMITIDHTDEVPTDVDYAGFDGYLVGLFGKDPVDLAIIEGTNQLVDLSQITDESFANYTLLKIINNAPKNVRLVIDATSFWCFTPSVMEALTKRPDLQVRVYFEDDDKIYYSTMPTGDQLLEDAGGKLVYMGFTGYVTSRYGATLYSEAE